MIRIMTQPKYFLIICLLPIILISCGHGSPDAESLGKLNARLHQGVKEINWSVVDSCLRKGADINAYDAEGTPTVIFAAMTGNPKFLERLIKKGLDVNLKRESYYGSSALMESGAVNDTLIGEVLLSHGADVNAIDTFGDPAINWAAYYGNISFAELLVQNGARADIQSKNGDAFDVALKQWQDDFVDYLISEGYGSPIESELAINLLKAVRENNPELLQFSLEQGGDPNQLDEAGSPVLVIAASKGYESVVNMLLKAGANIGSFNRVGQSALSRAAYFGHKDLVRDLIRAGASVNDAGGEYNLTPLISAANGGRVEIGKLLLDFGANPDAQDALNGFTPIMFATAYGHVDFVKLLIDSRANPYIKSFDGAGLYDMVSFSNNKEIHDLLQQYLLQDN